MTQQEIQNKANTRYLANTPNNVFRKQGFGQGYQQALADMQDGWIDVKDRLPDDTRDQIWVTNGTSVVLMYSWSVLRATDITHWMPIIPPSPPKAAKDSEKE